MRGCNFQPREFDPFLVGLTKLLHHPAMPIAIKPSELGIFRNHPSEQRFIISHLEGAKDGAAVQPSVSKPLYHMH